MEGWLETGPGINYLDFLVIQFRIWI